MKIAIFGCLHGMLNDMYEAVAEDERKTNTEIELILVCGDCQTVRHFDDLRCVAVPDRYKKLGDFHEYYSGRRKVPKLTIFVGGNHEASNYLMTLPYGGWICDNFYYLGYASVINYKGLRIAGISGIYNHRDCDRGRFESLPLDSNTVRSIYHTRSLDVFRLQLLEKNACTNNPIDIMLSHDWPARIYDHGDLQQLLRFKPHFKEDVSSRFGLGNPLTEPLVQQIKPRRWFAAHLHCKFYAKVQHKITGLDNDTETPDEGCTEFLSLNKIEKGRRFVEFLDISPRERSSMFADLIQLKSEKPSPELKVGNPEESIMETNDNETTKESAEKRTERSEQSDSFQREEDILIGFSDSDLHYDIEWLTVLRKTMDLENSSWQVSPCPATEGTQLYYPTDEDIQETIKLMNESGGLVIKNNFQMDEPVVYGRADGTSPSRDKDRSKAHSSSQHDELCARLQINCQFHKPTQEEIEGRKELFPARRARSHQPKSAGSYRNPRQNNHHNNYNQQHRNQYTSNNNHRRNHHNNNRYNNNQLYNDRGRGRGYPHRNVQRPSQRYVDGHQAHSSNNHNHRSNDRPVKKRAFEVDEDGCLPFYVDKKGDSGV